MNKKQYAILICLVPVLCLAHACSTSSVRNADRESYYLAKSIFLVVAEDAYKYVLNGGVNSKEVKISVKECFNEIERADKDSVYTISTTGFILETTKRLKTLMRE